ncbi:MAG TPA: glycosyltransferase family 39 protein [Solirubrobacteraceae bacterium]|jgi:4-amino-4-deoxy-L-arabinose transferase-like glycosyltransferase
MSAASASVAGTPRQAAEERRASSWARSHWPLLLLIALAAALRLATIDLQSFWFDEAFTPVYVIHPSFTATMHTMSHTENTPPLWYVLIWIWTRIFGTGVVAMRLPSAFAGIALVPVAWAIGDQLAGRRAALAAAAMLACNPLLVWYSQEARAYELYALTGGIAFLCFLRAERLPSGRRMAAFGLAGCLALLSHYFAVFLLVPMSLWLLRKRERWRVAVPAVGAIAVVGLALVPLLLAQGGNGTQWIGEWPLHERLEAIPQYYLTGYSGAPLGHAIELLVALPILVGLVYGLWRRLDAREGRGALVALALAACGILIPILLVGLGADYLAPRNLIAAMLPVTAVIAVIVAARNTGRVGAALVALTAIGFLAICIDVNLSPRLQRGDWKGVAALLEKAPPGAPAGAQDLTAGRVIATVHLGSAPLAYYLPGLARLRSTPSVKVTEIDEVGYSPLLSTAGSAPAPGFRLVARRDINGLLVYRFLSSRPQNVPAVLLRRARITTGEVDVLAPASLRSSA